EDADLKVAASAGLALREWVGQDFGIRIAQILPKKDDSGREFADPSGLTAFREGVQKWKDWWQTHQRDFPVAEAPRVDSFAERQLPASDFKLSDLNDSPVH